MLPHEFRQRNFSIKSPRMINVQGSLFAENAKHDVQGIGSRIRVFAMRLQNIISFNINNSWRNFQATAVLKASQGISLHWMLSMMSSVIGFLSCYAYQLKCSTMTVSSCRNSGALRAYGSNYLIAKR